MKNYTCPMHGDVRLGKDDKCPKCGMKLVPIKTNLKKLAFSATVHCFTGCSIGEIFGMVLGTIFNWPNPETIVVSTALAFLFGYSLTMLPLIKSGLHFAKALPLAFAADTASITIMELADNLVM